MRLAAIGIGQAGGKVLDRLLEHDRRWGYGFITSAKAINTARADLEGLQVIPQHQRVLIGRTRAHGHGVGADNELGADIAEDEESLVLGALDDIAIGQTDAFLLIAALGGGTGSGAGPVIARLLSQVYDEPVYGLGILPTRNEGGIYTLNAARSLKSFVSETDNLLLFDNDAWRKPGESIESGYDSINQEMVRRFGVLFSAGELSVESGVGENVVDASEINNTLQGGGISSVGHAVEQVDVQGRGLLSRFRDGRGSSPIEGDNADRITGLVRQATRGRLTIPCEVESAERALLVVSGPPHLLSRRGTELGREWLADSAKTLEVRGGDHPLDKEESVSATVVLAGVTDIQRIDNLQRHATDAMSDLENRASTRDEDLRALLEDEHDEIEPLI